MSKQIDLVSYRAELQQKIEAIDLLLGASSRYTARSSTRPAGGGGKRGPMSPAARARLAAIARARWRAAKSSGRSRL
jgi:hypothetical protein